MGQITRTLLLLLVSLVTIKAFTLPDTTLSSDIKKDAGKDFDFEFDEFAGESSSSVDTTAATSSGANSSSSEESDEDEELEPQAEMLPANFENVEPPGVDHMEMTQEVTPNAKMMREYQGKMVEPPEYQVRLAFPSDYDRVMGFMTETYFRSEPSLVNAGLAGQSSPTLMHQMYSAISEGMTIIIEDRHTNCVVGASVNSGMRREDVGKQERIAAACPECKRVKDLLGFYAFCSRQCDPWRNYCVDSLFECAYVAVHPKHQGKGLAKRLVEESWVLARDTAYRLFRIDCTSSYTARLAENFGWECILRIPYRRYIADGGEFVFTKIVPPHTEMRIFVDHLNHYDSYYPPKRRRKA